MSEQLEKESNETEELQIELTPEQLEELLGQDYSPININETLETEMVTSRTLYLSEEVGLDTVNYIIQLIHKFNRDDYDIPVNERQPITIYIDSVGGDLYRCLSLTSTIRASKTPIIGVGQGMIASAALILYLSTHYKYLSRFATVLYHELRAASDTETLREMQNKIAHYAQLQDTLDNFISENTTVPLKVLKNKRKRNLDWYISLEDLTKYKFYDELID